jgi:hypothetical protein
MTATSYIDDGVVGCLRSEQPRERNAKPDPPAEQGDRDQCQECTAEIPQHDSHGCTVRDRKAITLRSEHLQSDVAKCMHPEEGIQGIGSPSAIEPRDNVPSRRQSEQHQAHELCSGLRAHQIVHRCIREGGPLRTDAERPTRADIVRQTSTMAIGRTEALSAAPAIRAGAGW